MVTVAQGQLAARFENSGLAIVVTPYRCFGGNKMIQVFLLIVSIFYWRRIPKLKRLPTSDFPNVDPVEFEKWKEQELTSYRVFLWASWGALLISLAIGFVGGFLVSGPLTAAQTNALNMIVAGLWLISLLYSAVLGSKAKKLRDSLGIRWPPRAAEFRAKESMGKKS